MSEKKPAPDFSPLVEPTWLPGPAGALFALVYLPESASHAPAKWVLHLPAFAEEMNKSRAMVANQAREFARQGCAVVVPDLRGTGDSAGDFAQASWQGWREDTEFILGWMREQGAEEVTLWGLRLGSLLALDVAASLPGAASELLLWQPSLVGKTAMTQFLRLRMAAQMMQGGKESVSDMRNQLASGESLEVAGYTLNPELVSSLDHIDATRMELPTDLAVFWGEVASDAGRPLLPPSLKLIDAWLEQGIAVESTVVEGEQFWTTQEIASAPRLIDFSVSSILGSGLTTNRLAFQANGLNSSGERAVQFQCGGSLLTAILHSGRGDMSTGVVIVVGGPQYRVGSHRQFLLLARALAERGIPVFRFDYRGMGDSDGPVMDFLGIDSDIASAIDAFQEECPHISQLVIWGLCDAATAAAFYAPRDSRVTGLILLNPWVRSESSESKAYLKHYYWRRLFNRDFWSKLASGKLKVGQSLHGLVGTARRAISGSASGIGDPGFKEGTLIQRLQRSLSAFTGRVMLITSGNDLTAAEFLDFVQSMPELSRLLQETRFETRHIKTADHTFSTAEWRAQVEAMTADFVDRL